MNHTVNTQKYGCTCISKWKTFKSPHTKRSRYPECVRALRVSGCPCLTSPPPGVCGHRSELEGARAPLYRDSGVLWGIPLHADEPVGGTWDREVGEVFCHHQNANKGHLIPTKTDTHSFLLELNGRWRTFAGAIELIIFYAILHVNWICWMKIPSMSCQ